MTNQLNLEQYFNQKQHRYNANDLINYILYQIQTQKWGPNQEIWSENHFAMKFALSKSIVHAAFNLLKKANILRSVPCKSWYVSDYVNLSCLLNFEIQNVAFDFVVSISQKWTKNSKTLEDDTAIFQSMLDEQDELSFDAMFHCKKMYYKNDPNDVFSISKFGFVKQHFADFDCIQIQQNILHFLANSNHIVRKVIKHFKITSDYKNLDQKAILVKVYYAIYNQHNQLILVIKNYTNALDFNQPIQFEHSLDL